jgi:hypothetical protein
MSGMACPLCGTKKTWMTARFGHAFACVSCGEMLRIPDFYTKRILLVSFGVSLVPLLIYGERWFALIGLAALIFLPISLIVGTLMRHLWPPELQLDSDATGEL